MVKHMYYYFVNGHSFQLLKIQMWDIADRNVYMYVLYLTTSYVTTEEN